MTVRTLWSSTFDGGTCGASVTFDDSTLIMQALVYQNLETFDCKGAVSHNGVVVGSAVLHSGTASSSVNLIPLNISVTATAMPADARHGGLPWTLYDLPAGWSLSFGRNL